MNSFIPWVGGKSKLLWIINKMAPDHYSRFIDVFGGSGTVTMSRPIQPGCMEVYNDFNSNLTNLFCCVKNRPLALLAELGFLPLNTRDDFNVLVERSTRKPMTNCSSHPAQSRRFLRFPASAVSVFSRCAPWRIPSALGAL